MINPGSDVLFRIRPPRDKLLVIHAHSLVPNYKEKGRGVRIRTRSVSSVFIQLLILGQKVSRTDLESRSMLEILKIEHQHYSRLPLSRNRDNLTEATNLIQFSHYFKIIITINVIITFRSSTSGRVQYV